MRVGQASIRKVVVKLSIGNNNIRKLNHCYNLRNTRTIFRKRFQCIEQINRAQIISNNGSETNIGTMLTYFLEDTQW